ncbi:MAG: HD domain-containing protein [Ruminococcaceae bacterium]|nr:HD domain-containing protein [Oscillospiraceae bacterium]
MTFNLPKNVKLILDRLENAGFEAYCVGGCVRDTLMGLSPEDWDITTSALPEETRAIFSDFKTIDTGLKHGTLTVVIDKMPFEITTFRIDGDYDDNRHPKSINFTDKIANDLSRRDFTVNALAFNPATGIVDLFGGTTDIYNGIIKAVGDAHKRFNEDGLRIMRALRFASVLGFEIEKETSFAIHTNKELLKNISAERIAVELTKLLCGKNAFRILMDYADVFAVIIPEIKPAISFKQYGKKHAYDVWEHICHTVDTIPQDRILRLTMFLHDLGKVPTHKLNDKGDSTFKNHAAVGGEMAKEILTRLKFDKKTINRVSFLVGYHDFEPPETKTELKKHLKTKTPEDIRTLLVIKKSDRGALSESYRDISKETEQCLQWLREIEENNECCKISQLSVTGDDLLKKGYSGSDIGKALNDLLNAVIEGKVENTKTSLLTYQL